MFKRSIKPILAHVNNAAKYEVQSSCYLIRSNHNGLSMGDSMWEGSQSRELQLGFLEKVSLLSF